MCKKDEKIKCDNDQCIFQSNGTCYIIPGIIAEERGGIIRICTKFIRND